MKKIGFGLFLVCFSMVTSCSPNKFYLVNSEGIFSYNRHTGQLEFMWESHTQRADTISAVKRDSVLH